mmetsp:Transcript_36828/g.72941  ORF Transcript_36828/g.72941 Transcript_36828/m.72941 type:complete len:222 (+) Transcript_36828:850-1515(+)
MPLNLFALFLRSTTDTTSAPRSTKAARISSSLVSNGRFVTKMEGLKMVVSLLLSSVSSTACTLALDSKFSDGARLAESGKDVTSPLSTTSDAWVVDSGVAIRARLACCGNIGSDTAENWASVAAGRFFGGLAIGAGNDGSGSSNCTERFLSSALAAAVLSLASSKLSSEPRARSNKSHAAPTSLRPCSRPAPNDDKAAAHARLNTARSFPGSSSCRCSKAA